REQNATLGDDLDSAYEENDALERELEESEKDLIYFGSIVFDLRVHISDLGNENAELAEAKRTAGRRISSLEQKVSRQRGNIRGLLGKQTKLRSELANLRLDYNHALDQLDRNYELIDALQDLAWDYGDLEETFFETNADLEDAQDRNRVLRDMLFGSNEDLVRTQAELQDSRAALGRAYDEFNELLLQMRRDFTDGTLSVYWEIVQSLKRKYVDGNLASDHPLSEILESFEAERAQALQNGTLNPRNPVAVAAGRVVGKVIQHEAGRLRRGQYPVSETLTGGVIAHDNLCREQLLELFKEGKDGKLWGILDELSRQYARGELPPRHPMIGFLNGLAERIGVGEFNGSTLQQAAYVELEKHASRRGVYFRNGPEARLMLERPLREAIPVETDEEELRLQDANPNWISKGLYNWGKQALGSRKWGRSCFWFSLGNKVTHQTNVRAQIDHANAIYEKGHPGLALVKVKKLYHSRSDVNWKRYVVQEVGKFVSQSGRHMPLATQSLIHLKNREESNELRVEILGALERIYISRNDREKATLCIDEANRLDPSLPRVRDRNRRRTRYNLQMAL
ncbi:hypothetical protein ACFLZN_01745, partial [Nanoarchaeota archaeon]